MQKKLSIKKLEDSQVQITFEIPWDEVEKHRAAALETIGKHTKIDGFRPGKVPTNVLEGHIDEGSVNEEMAGAVVNAVFPEALIEKKIDAIGRPFIQITKLAKDNPFEFTAVVSVMPVVKLADYKKIAKAHASDMKEVKEITEKDIEEAIENIQQMYAKRKLFEKMQNMTDEEKVAEAAETGNNPDETQEEVQKRLDEKMEIPKLTNDFVKEIGKFENVEEFKKHLKEGLAVENERKSEEDFRIKTIEKIVEDSSMEIPPVMTALETEKMYARMQEDVLKMGMKFEDYVKGLGKTEGEIKKDMEGDAKKRAAAQLVINQIAKDEKVTPDETKVKAEVEQVMKAYPDVDEANARGYIESVMINDAVLKFLQELK